LGEYQRTLGFEEDGLEDMSYPLQRYGRYNTLNYNQSGFKIDQDHRLLYLSKIGDIRAKLYRKIEGYIKAVIIKREGKRWFAIVQTDPLNTTQSSAFGTIVKKDLSVLLHEYPYCGFSCDRDYNASEIDASNYLKEL
jgi:hypothetical protein